MALYTMDKVLRKPDYYDKVIKTVITKTPFQAIIGRGAKPIDWKQEVELEPEVDSYDLAAPEGGLFDRTKLGKRTNFVIEMQVQKFRSIKGWNVTVESEEMPSHTESKGEKAKARQMRLDAQELVKSIERTLSSDQEAVARGTSDDTVARTRGLMCWLKPWKSGQTAAQVHPVQPIDLRVVPRTGFDGDVKNDFTEEVLRKILTDTYLLQGDDTLHMTALVGAYLKAKMSDFLGQIKKTESIESALRLTQSASEKKKQLICDFFEYDNSMLRVLTDNHLLAVADADTKKYSIPENARWSGAFIRPEFWTVDPFIPLHNVDLPKEGDEISGYHMAALRLACRNPLAQFRVMHEADESSSSSSSSSSSAA